MQVSERTLARDAIHRAKPGGEFLADEHTLYNWLWAQWRPKLFDRNRYDAWVASGSQDLTQRANRRAKKILRDHKVLDLPPARRSACRPCEGLYPGADGGKGLHVYSSPAEMRSTTLCLKAKRSTPAPVGRRLRSSIRGRTRHEDLPRKLMQPSARDSASWPHLDRSRQIDRKRWRSNARKTSLSLCTR